MSESRQNEGPWAARALGAAERVVYYGSAVFLLGTIAMVFFSAGADVLRIGQTGAQATALAILDKVLLVFIFAELLGTISTVIRERRVTAEPFLLIGLIAVVRSVLAVTVSIEQSLGTPRFDDLLAELAVLTALVIALAVALYFTRRSNPRDR